MYKKVKNITNLSFKFTFIIIFSLVTINSFSQGVAINTDGSNADGSAMLDIKSTNAGILVPRLTQVQRNAIISPATGLMIFQTDNTPGFYYNAGTSASPFWIRLTIPTDNFDDADADATNEIQTLSISDHEITLSDGGGSVVVPDNNTTYSAGNQLTLSGTTFNVSEGSGSGLDADLLDGHQWSEITGANGWIDDGTTVRLETSTDNVGIGTTSPKDDLQVLGGVLVGSDNSEVTEIKDNSIYLAKDIDGANYRSVRLFPTDNSGYVGLSIQARDIVSTSGLPSSANLYKDLMYINGYTGNVGIGNTAPTQSLHISGNMRLTGGLYDMNNTQGTSGQVLKSNGSATYWTTDNNTTYSAGNQLSLSGTTFNVTEGSGSGLDADLLDGHQWSEITGANGWIDDGTNVRLETSTDKVGIGTNTPTSKMQIGQGVVSQQWSGSTPYVYIQGTDNDVATSALKVVDENMYTMLDVASTGDGEVGQVYIGGNLGVGAITPAYKLDVNGDLRVNSTSYAGRDYRIECGSRQEIYSANDLVEYVSGNKVVTTGTSGGANKNFYIASESESTKYFTADGTNQRIGIGTATPTQVLHISGNMRLTGGLYDMNNTQGTSGQVLKSNGSATYWTTDNNTTYSAGNDLDLSGTTFNIEPTVDYVDYINELVRLSCTSASTYDKLRVWNSSSYAIGMVSAQSYGYLNDYAMTFTMNTDADRGFLWRDAGDAASDGAMSLTTDGRLTVKSIITTPGNISATGTTSTITTPYRVGIVDITPDYALDVEGDPSNTKLVYARNNYNSGSTGAQSSIYSYLSSGQQGSGYGVNNSRATTKGYAFYGYAYTFGVAGYRYNDGYNRGGGVFGGSSSGNPPTSWGSLGYRNSGSTHYGAYHTSEANGSGFLSNNGQMAGVGSGSFGDMMGGWIRGDLMGLATSGEMYALYNDGNTYTEGYSADIINTVEGRKATYSVTSTKLKVYDDGNKIITENEMFVPFSNDFSAVISDKQNPTITVSSVGGWAPLYIKEVRNDGFIVANDNYNGDEVEFSWIAVAERIDSELASLPEDIKDNDFNQNMKGFMFNENVTTRNATPMWWDGAALRFDRIPETPVNEEAKKAEEERMNQN